MKVAFVHNGRGWGGAPTSLFNVINKLQKDCFEKPTIVCLEDQELINRFNELNVNIIPFKRLPRYSQFYGKSETLKSKTYRKERIFAEEFSSVWKKFVKDNKFDLVHLNSSVLCDLIKPSKDAGSKVVQVIRETLEVTDSYPCFIDKVGLADAVVHISEYDKKVNSIKGPRIEVIRNWPDEDLYKKNERESKSVRTQYNIDDQDVVILYGGGTSPIKGGLVLCKSLRYIKVDKPVAVIFAGNMGSLKKGLLSKVLSKIRYISTYVISIKYNYAQQMIKNIKKCPGNVAIVNLGFQKNIEKIYAIADINIVPFSQPHQARAIFEAAWFNIPSIVSDYPCFKDEVIHLNTGIKFKPGDSKHLASLISDLVNDDSMRKKLGLNAGNYLKIRHDPVENQYKYINLYKDLLKLNT